VMEVAWPNHALQSVSLSPIQDAKGKAGGWMMILRDVTHLKNARKT